MLMVKSDAYGHGLRRVAQACRDIVDGFGVATLEEGLELRSAGIDEDILVLICAPDEMEAAINAGLDFGIFDKSQLEVLSSLVQCGRVSALSARPHIKVDTGMHRLGFPVGDVGEVLRELKNIDVSPRGVYSHLRCRDFAQVKAFDRACALVKSEFTSVTAHLAASGNLRVKSLAYDEVRLGVDAYKGAMTVKSRVICSRKVLKGERISYGNFRAPRDMNTAIVFGGYGDGVQREFPSRVIIGGRECRPVGRVCMDMFAVDTGDSLPRAGDDVTLYSPSLAPIAAKDRRTIGYTLMTGWHGRIKRIYDQIASEEDSP